MGIWRLKKSLVSSFSSLFQLSHSTSFSSSSTIKHSPLQNVGFIGLGNMGAHMAMNLIKSGYNVSVHDVNAAAVKPFLDKGIKVIETPKKIAEANDVVITMLPSSAHVMDVYTGTDGLLQNGSSVRPWLFIDSSTIDPLVSRKLSLSVSSCSLREKLGVQESPAMLDAPVSGGILAAEAGTLTFMVGGEEEAYQAAEPLFVAMGRASLYCGQAGNGLVAKICNNVAMAISMIGLSEALAVGQSLGISATTLTTVINSSSGRCWSRKQKKIQCYLLRTKPVASDSYNPVPGVIKGVPSSRDYQIGFSSKLMAKDLDLAAASAKEAATKHPFISLSQKMFHKLCAEGHETEDFSCVFRHYYNGKDEFYA